MNSLRRNKITLFGTGLLVLVISLEAQNKTGQTYAGISNLYCFTNGKIEKITGKRRATLSPKVIRAWKLGNLGFTYAQYCGLAQINPMAVGDIQFHNKTELSDQAQSILNRLAKGDQEKNVLQKETLAALHFAELADRMHYSDRCEKQFASKAGIGPLGRVVKETLSHNAAKDLITHNISFGGACPGYREMTTEQRKNLWVFVMMSMSHYESSCQDQASNQGPNGTAAGLLQLHDESENLYASWDPDLNCDVGAARNSRQTLKCGLTMLGNQLYKGSRFFDEGSHWQVLRQVQKPGSQAHQIRYALAQIPDCQANAFYLDIDLERTTGRTMGVQNWNSQRSIELTLLH
jgi:hypothetical protein